MKIDVFTVPSEVDEVTIRGQSAVVIDVLRTSSTMLQAFSHGCREIYPVESIERALHLHSALFTSDVLLCGERDGIKINGFHLGNSPFEYTRNLVEHKSLIFTSTNGTATLIRTRNCKEAYLCGFQNIELVSETAAGIESLSILCAGKNNHFAQEDVVCAGMLIKSLQKRRNGDLILSDAARMAVGLYEANKDDLGAMVRQADHGMALMRLGKEKDLDFCIQTNTIQLVPQYIEGKIRLCEKG
ncbi:2-phosphosulfolactate phosphatase [candidate division KSB1 bacterium]